MIAMASNQRRVSEGAFNLTLVSNIEKMLAETDNPEGLSNSLRKHGEKDPLLVLRIARKGWESEYMLYRDKVMNVGVVGALFLTIVAAFVHPLEPVDADDMWTDERATYVNIWIGMMALSTMLAVAGTLGSLALLVWSASVVSDADDFLWFADRYHPFFWVVLPVQLSVVTFCVALMFGVPVMVGEPIASITFFGILGSMIIYGCMVGWGNRVRDMYNREGGDRMKPKLMEAIKNASYRAPEAREMLRASSKILLDSQIEQTLEASKQVDEAETEVGEASAQMEQTLEASKQVDESEVELAEASAQGVYLFLRKGDIQEPMCCR